MDGLIIFGIKRWPKIFLILGFGINAVEHRERCRGCGCGFVCVFVGLKVFSKAVQSGVALLVIERSHFLSSCVPQAFYLTWALASRVS